MPVCAISSHAALASAACAPILAAVPLHLTAKERSTLATILALLVLGLIGMAIFREEPPAPRPTASSQSSTPPRP